MRTLSRTRLLLAFYLVTHEEKAQLRHQLELRVSQLREMLDRPSEGSAVAPDNAIGRLTRLDAMQAGYMNEALRREHTQELAAVERALHQIDGDEYGMCHNCEEPIPFARLVAKPDAQFCVACAEARERRG
ncbi:MAG TPA: TraR/DksA C4-type zinc finger protein [Vicinamibacterales bacterium]|nr:TraR/DksA C4-type zinc finger protein [Vicinamibacterales bacterium]